MTAMNSSLKLVCKCRFSNMCRDSSFVAAPGNSRRLGPNMAHGSHCAANPLIPKIIGCGSRSNSNMVAAGSHAMVNGTVPG